MYKTIYNTVTLVYDLLQISAAYSTSMLIIIPNYAITMNEHYKTKL